MTVDAVTTKPRIGEEPGDAAVAIEERVDPDESVVSGTERGDGLDRAGGEAPVGLMKAREKRDQNARPWRHVPSATDILPTPLARNDDVRPAVRIGHLAEV